MDEIVRNDGYLFKVMGQEIWLYSEELGYDRNTVADMNGFFHHMGSEPPNVATAVFAWQEVNGRELTSEEFRQVMIDNQIISAST
jgi:hypothetical protein